jgi:hypothetical protein
VLSVGSFIMRLLKEFDVCVSPQLVHRWITIGVAGIPLPYQRVGGKVHIQWREYRRWQRAVTKAKTKRRGSGRRTLAVK